jgi:pimeloyl-ACP methyl ester carboxylesterase
MRKSVGSRGLSISYRTAGSGKPILLLAGWSQCADDWWDAGYVRNLADYFHIIAVDRLGHGQTDKPHDPSLYREEGLVADFTAVLDAEGVDRSPVWGYSMGGKAAYSLATLEAARISAVVTGGYYPSSGGEAVRQEWIKFGQELSNPKALQATSGNSA